MHGKVKVFFLALLMVALAGAAQAEMIFPVGYTLTYSAQAGGSSWTSTLSFTSTTTLQMISWDSPSQTVSAPVELTVDTFFLDQGQNLQPFFRLLPEGNSWTFTGDNSLTVTATVVDIIDSFTVEAGTFNNVYKVHYESTTMNEDFYWLPGLGLLKAVDYGKDPDHIHTLTSYATPIPPSVLLLGSGLMGLAVLRRFRKG